MERFVTQKVWLPPVNCPLAALGNINILIDNSVVLTGSWAPGEYVGAMYLMLQQEKNQIITITTESRKLEDFVAAAFA